MAIRFDGRITGPGDLSKYDRLSQCAPDRLAVVQDPLGQRGWVMRAIRRSDDTTVLNGYRAEADNVNTKRPAPCVEWYEWETLVLSSEYKKGRPFVIILQVHDDWSSGGAPHWPPVEVRINESSLHIFTNAALVQNPQLSSEIIVTQCVADVPFPFDRWVRLVMRADYKTDGTGALDVWFDGRCVCSAKNIYNCYPGTNNYAQHGAYTGLDQLPAGTERRVYSTGVRIYDDATTHAEMGVSADIPLVSSGSF